MKKLLLIGLMFLFSNTIIGQTKIVKSEKGNEKTEKKSNKSTSGVKEFSKVNYKKRKTAEKAPKVKDKVSGKYKDKTVYTDAKGMLYYVNKDGNKTYLDKK
jgi:hypothetical protein